MKLDNERIAEWLTVIKDGKIEVPLDAFRQRWNYWASKNPNFEGEIVMVQIYLTCINIKDFKEGPK